MSITNNQNTVNILENELKEMIKQDKNIEVFKLMYNVYMSHYDSNKKSALNNDSPPVKFEYAELVYTAARYSNIEILKLLLDGEKDEVSKKELYRRAIDGYLLIHYETEETKVIEYLLDNEEQIISVLLENDKLLLKKVIKAY